MIHDQLGVGLHEFVNDAQAVGFDGAFRFSHLDDGVGQFGDDLGFGGPPGKFDIDIDRISVVDVTPTGTNDISGHMYHMFNPAVVEDLRVLLGVPLEGDSRKYGRVAMATPGFWSLETVAHDEE